MLKVAYNYQLPIQIVSNAFNAKSIDQIIGSDWDYICELTEFLE